MLESYMQAIKFTAEGQELLTLGVRGKPGHDTAHFCKPTAVRPAAFLVAASCPCARDFHTSRSTAGVRTLETFLGGWERGILSRQKVRCRRGNQVRWWSRKQGSPWAEAESVQDSHICLFRSVSAAPEVAFFKIYFYKDNHTLQVAVSNTGDVFVADGYCNSRIMHFSPSGSFIQQIRLPRVRNP